MNRPELEQGWRTQLQQLRAPSGFHEQLHHNLTTQLRAPVPAWLRMGRKWGLAAASVALMLGMALLLVRHGSAPPLIAAAHAHASEERSGSDIDLTYSTWLADAGLQSLPPGGRVVMAKDCTLAGLPARHLRVSLGNAAYADIFITRAEKASAGAGHGEIADRTWWRIEPDTGATVVVLFDSQVAPEQQRRWAQRLSHG